MFGDAGILTWRTANLGTLALLLITILWRRYATRRDRYAGHDKNGASKGLVPSTFPYAFPLLGSLPVSYLWKPRAFVLDQK